MITAKDLKKLEQLKDKGVITDDEFNAKKEEFLGQSSNRSSNKRKKNKIKKKCNVSSSDGDIQYLIGVIIAILLISYCSLSGKKDVFYENGAKFHSINSVAGKKCFEKASQIAKWGIKVNDDANKNYFDYFLVDIGDDIEKHGNCKLNQYESYGGADNVLVNNAFGATRKIGINCIYNKITNEYTVDFVERGSKGLDNLAEMFNGDLCERYEQAFKAIEYEASFNR